MDSSQDDKNRLKRSGKKRPQSQQQQESGAGSTSAANTNTTTSTLGNANTLPANINSSLQSQNSANTSSSINSGSQAQGISVSNVTNQQSSQVPQQLTGKIIEEPSLNQKVTVNSELLEYVNKLEYLVVSTRQKLLRERKAYQQIISSLALYFDAKGIRSQQVEQYVDSVVDSLQANQEESDLEFDQLDWVKFLHDKKSDKLKRSRDMIDLQGSNLHTSTGASGSNINSTLQNSIALTNGLQNLTNQNTNSIQSSIQNSKVQNGQSSSFGSVPNNNAQSNIIRLPMGNNVNEEKKGSQLSSQNQSKLKSKGTSNSSNQQTQSQLLSKNYPVSNVNNSGSISGILDVDGEEPKNKKKKKPNQSSGNISEMSGLQVNALNSQQIAFQQQQQYELLMQQEQQKMLYQQFLHAQQANQIQPKMNNQIFQQYLMSFQPQSNAQ